MKYMLVEVCERNISDPILFNSFGDAQNEMVKLFADVTGLNPEEARHLLDNGGRDRDMGIFDEYAYAERCEEAYDWRIFQVGI